MPANRYRINEHIVDIDDLRFQPLLAHAYCGSGPRPRCLCRFSADGVGVEMYISRVGDKYLLKRMPGTGSLHHPGCASFEPPPEPSGLGEVLGSAICSQPKEGITTLALGFPLTRSSGRAAPTASDGESDSVHTDGTKLRLRGLLHYLWDEAGLTSWTPVTVKRPWATVRREVLRAARRQGDQRQSSSGECVCARTVHARREERIGGPLLGNTDADRGAGEWSSPVDARDRRSQGHRCRPVRPQNGVQAPARLPVHGCRRSAPSPAQDLRSRVGFVGSSRTQPPHRDRDLRGLARRRRFTGAGRVDGDYPELDSVRDDLRQNVDRQPHGFAPIIPEIVALQHVQSEALGHARHHRH